MSGLPDQMIWVKLAHHMGLGEYFPWKNCEEGIDELLGELGITYQDILAKGGIYEYEKRRYRKYEEDGFSTPSGKVEMYPEPLKALGFNPTPIRKDVLDGIEASDEFPLFLTTGGNVLCYTHWQYRYIPKLRKMSPDPVFDIHPNTALLYGLSEGDSAELRSAYGKIQLKAHLTPKIRPDTIHIAQGWEEANANLLTGVEDLDPVSGFPNLKSLKCCVQKI
jgi:anaerobic selenocysteine-containing dehydrogenase